MLKMDIVSRRTGTRRNSSGKTVVLCAGYWLVRNQKNRTVVTSPEFRWTNSEEVSPTEIDKAMKNASQIGMYRCLRKLVATANQTQEVEITLPWYPVNAIERYQRYVVGTLPQTFGFDSTAKQILTKLTKSIARRDPRDITNDVRSDSAKLILQEFMQMTGCDYADGEAMRDLFCNLRHLADREKWDIEHFWHGSRDVYREECGEVCNT